MICPHCRTQNPETALRCSKCGIVFSVVDEGETLSPTGGAASSTAPQPETPSAASGVPSSPGSSSKTPSASGGWVSASGQALSFETGTEFGDRYRIEGLLGEGGMGAVYKAYDKDLDRTVALKLLRPGLMADASAMQRFKQELLLASKISHKNILRIHDLGDVGGIKFISMAYVEGDDLHGILKKHGRLPINRAVAFARQLCAALGAAHAEEVVHRDLKPHNVLVDAQDNAYISDFGLAKSVEAGAAGMTRAGEFLGTPRYMSPEQVEGGKLDHRSDLYSLGLMLYEMVTGDVPFTSDSTINLMFQRVKQKPKSPDKVNPEIPSYLTRIIMRCLEKDQNRRYQSAAEILADLEAGSGVAASRSGLRSGSRSIVVALPPPEQQKWWYLGGGVVLLLLLSLAIPQVRHRIFPRSAAPGSSEQKPITLLIADFNNATGDPVFDGTLEPAFSIAVEGASFISTYNRADARKRGAQLQAGATSLNESVARLVAVREGLNVVVLGSIRRQGDQFKLRVETVDGLSGNEISSFEADAEKKDVLTAVGKLAAKVRNVLGDTTPESIQLAGAETFSAGSLEAAQEYARAQEFQWAGKWDDAIQHYEMAVKLDPELGRAYAGVAAIYANMGRQSDAEKYYKLAFSKIDRMTDREKYRTRGGYYLMLRNPDRAIEELSELVRRFPADRAGIANLALAYAFKRDMRKALEVGRQAVERNPKNVLQRNNLGLYAMYASDFETAIEEQKTVLELNSSFVKGYVGLALSQLAAGRPAEAIETYHRLEKQGDWGISTAAIGLADIALYEGRVPDAVAILEKGIADDQRSHAEVEIQATKFILLANAHLLAGKQGPALAAVDKALATSRADSILFWAAQTYPALNREPKALELAAELGKRLDPDPQAHAKLIEGEVLLKRGKPQEAMKVFQESRKLADTWLSHLNLGRAYLEAQAFAEAYSEFETCLKRRGEATAIFLDEIPTYRVFPAVYYYMGRAQEGLKSSGAADSYKAFLAIRGKGVEDPLVADARRRIAGR